MAWKGAGGKWLEKKDKKVGMEKKWKCWKGREETIEEKSTIDNRKEEGKGRDTGVD